MGDFDEDELEDDDLFDVGDVDEPPRCQECGCDLETEEHAFDCLIGEEEEADIDGEEDE
jgi:hypothetical protein